MIDSTPQSSSSNKTVWIVLGGCLVLMICLACFSLVGLLAGIVVYNEAYGNPFYTETPTAVSSSASNIPAASTPILPPATVVEAGKTAVAVSPTAAAELDPSATLTPPLPLLALNPPKVIDQNPIAPRAFEDLERFYQLERAPLDYYEAAVRLGSKNVGSRTVEAEAYAIGDVRAFTGDDGRIRAELAYITDHAYFWIEEGLDLDKSKLREAADRLESAYYPRLVELFGQEWQPGVDNDPHFSLLHVQGDPNAGELGYFSDGNEYPRAIFSDSNEQEIVFMIMGNLDLGEELYYGTLVHEIQHLIHWNMDSNEEAWLNEGLSQLAEIHNGLYTADGYDYLIRPETRLNDWSYDDAATDAHYSASYLYSVYLWEQLGETAVQALARHPANGMASVNAILQEYAPDRSLVEFTSDWAVANYLDNPAAGSAYGYDGLHLDERPSFRQSVESPELDETYTLDPFAADYIELDFNGAATISFAGDTLVPLISDPPPTGEQFWYAPPTSNVNAQLTREFDLREVSAASLTFDAWYELEEDWDFAYLSISTDDGATWAFLRPDHLSAGEYGPAWNGRSADESGAIGGWVEESVSLNSYTGQSVLIRFELLTDAAINGRGFAVDNIAIPAIGYSDDLEGAPGGFFSPLISGWNAVGFVKTGWQLPQQWSVRLIRPNGEPQVETLTLDAFNQGQWQVDVGNGEAVLLIMPLTPFVDQPADYWLNIAE